MSDKREVQEKPLIILRNAEDYPTWKSYTVSRLQQQNCDWAITGRPQPNLDSVRATLIEDGFAAADVRPSSLVSALRDEKKNHFIALTKSAGLILELVDKSLQPLLNNKSAAEMWVILKNLPAYLPHEHNSYLFRCLQRETLGVQRCGGLH